MAIAYHLVFYFIEMCLLLYVFFVIPRTILPLKKAWQENDRKKIQKIIVLLLAGVIAIGMYLQMFNENMWRQR